MSAIEVSRAHRLGFEEAGRRVRAMLADLQARSSTFEEVTVTWSADGRDCTFAGQGVSGTIRVEAESVTVTLTLEGMMSMFRSVARDKIDEKLALHLM
ncbi:MAG: polyhydroxyalkanoic acid system family protein [Acidobacteria bacterium]|nr:polyhydroxyalkanoic acid system family protein [Acidobacteriota bacterium]